MHETRPTLRLGTDAASLVEAGRLLANGALVAFPTETVYGLGADATDSAAMRGSMPRKAARASIR